MKTKMLAVLAVLAMAFAGVAAFAVTEQNDAAGEAAPVSFAYGKSADYGTYTAMKVIVYNDKAIAVDTHGMDLGDENMFYVGLTALDAAYTNGTSLDAEVKIGPIASQNGKLWINGEYVFASKTNAAVALYSYAAPETIISIASATYVNTAADLVLKTNHSEEKESTTVVAWPKVNFADTTGEYAAFADATYERFASATMDKTIEGASSAKPFDGTNFGYALKGWSLSYVADSKIVLQPAASVSIEDIIIAMADHIRTNNVEASTGVLKNPIDSNDITLYAIWEEVLFTMEVGDITAGDVTAGKFADDFAFNTSDVRLNPAGAGTAESPYTQDGYAYISSKVSSNSFGLLKIVQDVPSQYKYTLKVYYATVDSATGEKTWTLEGVWQTDTLTKAKIEMINNGLYRISAVKADLRIEVTMAAADVVPFDGYNFAIDNVDNSEAATTGGNVRLSLDLYDYKATDDDTLTINGTYFKTLGTTGTTAVRIYGNIDNIDFADASATGTIKGYIDLKEDAGKITKATQTMAITDENSVFDLEFNLGKDVSIYAAQGSWTQPNVDSDSGTEGVQPTEVLTPWALYKA